METNNASYQRHANASQGPRWSTLTADIAIHVACKVNTQDYHHDENPH